MKTILITIFSVMMVASASYTNANNDTYDGDYDCNHEDSISTLEYDMQDCWWEVSSSPNVQTKWGVSCGSNNSLKVYYRNPFNYRIKAAFYIFDTNNQTYNNRPYVVSLNPGQRAYHHQCHSNGRYVVAVKRYEDSDCRFPNSGN